MVFLCPVVFSRATGTVQLQLLSNLKELSQIRFTFLFATLLNLLQLRIGDLTARHHTVTRFEKNKAGHRGHRGHRERDHWTVEASSHPGTGLTHLFRSGLMGSLAHI